MVLGVTQTWPTAQFALTGAMNQSVGGREWDQSRAESIFGCVKSQKTWRPLIERATHMKEYASDTERQFTEVMAAIAQELTSLSLLLKLIVVVVVPVTMGPGESMLEIRVRVRVGTEQETRIRASKRSKRVKILTSERYREQYDRVPDQFTFSSH